MRDINKEIIKMEQELDVKREWRVKESHRPYFILFSSDWSKKLPDFQMIRSIEDSIEKMWRNLGKSNEKDSIGISQKTK